MSKIADPEQPVEPVMIQLQEVLAPTGVDGKSELKFESLGVYEGPVNMVVPHTRIAGFPLIEDRALTEVFVCNFTHDTALRYRKRMPVVFLNVWSIDLGVQNMLFQLFLYFHIDPTNTHDENEFIQKPLTGKFTVEVVIDDENSPLDQQFDVFPGRKETIDKLVSFLRTKEMKVFIEEMIEEINRKRTEKNKNKLRNLNKIPKPTISLK